MRLAIGLLSAAACALIIAAAFVPPVLREGFSTAAYFCIAFLGILTLAAAIGRRSEE